jgi:hypothetical protein
VTKFILRRLLETANATLGQLEVPEAVLCCTLEDLNNVPKIPNWTRIPAGEYPLALVAQSGFNYKYQRRFAELGGARWHPGIVSIENVPGFDLIRMHMGNTHEDTAGCVLLGGHTSGMNGGYLHNSRKTYVRVYPILRDAISEGGATLEVIDP